MKMLLKTEKTYIIVKLIHSNKKLDLKNVRRFEVIYFLKN